MPKEALEQAGTRIIVIGCGEYNLRAGYVQWKIKVLRYKRKADELQC